MGVEVTLIGHIDRWASERPNEAALLEMNASGGWDKITWKQYAEHLRTVARGLLELGLQPGDGVGIVAANRPEWVICEMACFAARGLLAPIYTTNTKEQVAYLVSDANAKVVVCDDQVQLDKLIAAKKEGLCEMEHIITMDELNSDDPCVISYPALMEKGRAASGDKLETRMDEIAGDDVAMLIYTSGTTGQPKGAMYTHDGIQFMGDSTLRHIPELAGVEEIRSISYLPLCHTAEQGFTNFVGIPLAAKVHFCRDLKKIKDYLIAVKPHFFLGVPRVWEKFEAAMDAKFAQASGLKATLLGLARRTELEGFEQGLRTGSSAMGLRRTLANKVVLSKIRAALGLDDLILAVTGAAPISSSTLNFFASIGIVIHEGYGMTETTAFAAVQPYGRPKFGTIGVALPDVGIRIAEDGEIMLQGANMVLGYHGLEEKTKELWSDGWMHTGDLGSIDADGYVTITGRKKDIIITAGGKNVAPQEIESLLQALPGVGQGVVVGDRQPYLCALLVLDPEALPSLEKASGLHFDSTRSAAGSKELQGFFDKLIAEKVNSELARYQTIKKFEIMPEPFSVEGGELTPTMKVKRNIVREKYAETISGFYDS